MTANHPSSSALVCEIVAEARLAAVLGSIVRTCADDLQQLVTIRSRAAKVANATSITVHLPVAAFLESDAAWRLAFRIACFCPDARVSVLARAGLSTGHAADDRAA